MALDVQTILNFVLALLTLVFGGLNIFQLLTFKAYKRQRNAEADQEEIKSLSEIIRQNQAEIGRLSQRLIDADRRATELENKYNTLYDKYDKIRDELETYKLTHK